MSAGAAAEAGGEEGRLKVHLPHAKVTGRGCQAVCHRACPCRSLWAGVPWPAWGQCQGLGRTAQAGAGAALWPLSLPCGCVTVSVGGSWPMSPQGFAVAAPWCLCFLGCSWTQEGIGARVGQGWAQLWGEVPQRCHNPDASSPSSPLAVPQHQEPSRERGQASQV